jgi:SAM-dependent methyltransferase
LEEKGKPAANEAQRTPFDDGALYDVLFGELRFDLDFYLELAGQANGPVLEVACGTGRILIPCLQNGVDIDGLDFHLPMLEALKQKAAALGLHPRVSQADMRGFRMPRQYRLIFIAFNGFVHCLSTKDQLDTLRACRNHLLPGGALVFNTFFPGISLLSGPQGVPVLEGESMHPATGLPVRIFDTRTFDRIQQIQYSQIEIQELDAQGNVAVSHRSQTSMRWTFKPEMELLLGAAGYSRWQIYGGFDRRPLEHEDDLMVVFASL